MSAKKIIQMASDEDIMYYLSEIARIKSNMDSKTSYEKKSANNEMKALANKIKDILEGV